MTEFLIETLVALPVLLLWLAIIALVARSFGVRLPYFYFGKSKSTLQPMTFPQYMMFMGVLGWGCGMVIFSTVADYLASKYWNGSSHDLSAGRMLLRALWWLLAGLLFGWMSWNTRSGKRTE